MNVDLARIQFAFTSINHFLFVPITIGLAFRRRVSRSDFQPASPPSTPPGPRRPAVTPDGATPPARRGT